MRPTVMLYFFRLGGSRGGAERMLCVLSNALVTRGFRVHVVSWDAEDAASFYWMDPAVTWHRLGFNGGVADKVRRARSLARLLRKERIETLVGFVMSADKTVYAAARMAGVRLIVAERNAPSMYRWRYGALKRWTYFGLLHLADRIAVQFPGFAAGYPSTLRGRIEDIPNPVGIAERRAKPASCSEEGRFTLLAVSRIDAVQKRLDCLVRAFAPLAARHPQWDLRIIGDGPDQERLQALSRSTGLNDRVLIEPSRTAVFETYARAHLFAIPSLWEGFPNALAEAQSHGLPAVGFREAAGVADLIDDGVTGWLADGLSSPEAFEKTLGEAMSAPDERARRGRLAREAMREFEPEAQLDRWAELIRTVSGADQG